MLTLGYEGIPLLSFECRKSISYLVRVLILCQKQAWPYQHGETILNLLFPNLVLSLHYCTVHSIHYLC